MSASEHLGKHVKNVLRSNEAYEALDSHPDTHGCDFGSGGCRVAAEAISKSLPGSKIHTIVGNNKPQHYAVSHEGRYIDSEGSVNSKTMLRRWQSRVPGSTIETSHIDSSEIPHPVEVSNRVADLFNDRRR